MLLSKLDVGKTLFDTSKWADCVLFISFTLTALKPPKTCQTENTYIIGGENYTPNSFIQLIQDYGLESNVSWMSAKRAKQKKKKNI